MQATVRDYVPLVTISLVLLDVVLGQPFLKKVMSKVYGTSHDFPDDVNPSSTTQPTKTIIKKGMIDADLMAKTALEQAELAKSLKTWTDLRKGDKENIAELKNRVERQLDDG